MKLSVVLPYWFDRPPLEALAIAANAEKAGYAELWVGEMMTFDAFALAGAIAGRTPSLRLVVGPLAVGLRDPALLALGIASVTALGGRPADLALGASTPTVVAEWHGRPWRRTVTQLRETVAALRPLLAGERSAFRGETVSSNGFRLINDTKQTRLCVAAFGPSMLAAAGALADRVVLNLVTPGLVAAAAQKVAEAAARAGRPAPPLTVWVACALNPGNEALAQMARQLVAYVGAAGYGEMFAAAGFGDIVALARGGAHPRDVAAAMPLELLRAIGALGSAAEIRSRLAEYAAAGADVVGIVPITAEDEGGAALLKALA